MHFSTLVLTAASLAIVHASPAIKRLFGNETTTGWAIITTLPGNSSDSSTVSASETQSVITSVGSTTLTYTLGPEGSSSVVTTVVERTSTTTMTSTVYITLPDPESPSTSADYTGFEPPIETGEPLASITGFGGSSYSDTGGYTEPTDAGSDSDWSTATTNDMTSTVTITLEPVETGSSAGAAPQDGTDFSSGSNSIASPGAGNLFQSGSSDNSDWYGHGGHHSPHGGCSVTTVTATIVEQSTITVTEYPTSTDNIPANPTSSFTYGFGNGTDTTSFPTASSGFLKLYRRSPITQV